MTQHLKGPSRSVVKFLLLVLCLFSLHSDSFARSQWIEFHALSVGVEPAMATNATTKIAYSLGFSYTGAVPADNEIGRVDMEGGFAFGGSLVLQRTNSFESTVWQFGIQLPTEKDENVNGVPDFFDYEETENGESFGLYIFIRPDGEIEERPILATWTRPAKSGLGTVVVELPDERLIFTHRFRIIQWGGDYTYTVSGNTIAGNVLLARPDNQDLRLSGTMQMQIVSSSSIALTSCDLETPNGARVSFGPASPAGMQVQGIYFTGPVVCSDGRPETPAVDFNTFLMIVESPDNDQNGRPDITQQDPPNPNIRILMEVARVAEGIRILIRGQQGVRYMLQKSSAVSGKVWDDVQLITMDVNPKAVTVAAEDGEAYFRIKL